MDKETECDIAKGLQQGDHQAWIKLYKAYSKRVWVNVARSLGSDSTAVADIVQDVFIKTADSAKNFDLNRGSLWVWLWRITKDQIALYYRKENQRSRLKQAQLWWSLLDGEKADWIDSKVNAPPDILESRELAVLVRHSLATLPSDYQRLLIAKYIDGLAMKEIAHEMNSSLIATRSKLVRAKKVFRKVFRKLVSSEINDGRYGYEGKSQKT
jgi:RNA polymerase sigma-70 factor (ECF subfamily)